jgi:hypothetical protein
MAGPKNKLGALGAIGKRLLADGEELTAAQRAEAGRKAAELIKSQPLVKASEALGQQMEKGMKRTTTTQADRTRVGGGNIGGAPFSAISEADPAYAGKVWGVMDANTAKRLTNLTTPETAWTTMLGSANQLKTNPIVFDKLKRQFVDAMKQGKLSPELEAKINHNLALTFGEGAQIRDPSIWKQADTFDKRAALADLMMGQGITPKKGGVALGGEKSGKGVIFKPTDTLIRETEPTLLHPEHGGDAPTFAAGPRLFTLEKESVYRPDLHPGFPTLLTGKDLEVNMIPTPTEVYLPEWHKQFKKKNPNRKPSYYDLALGVKGEGLPSQELNDEYIRHLLREGFKDGGAVDISKADKRLAKAIENRMAKGGEVDLEAADARLSAAIEARMGMAGGGKVKGAAKAFKKLFADDVVNGMRIRQDIPNQSSIGASLTDYSTHGLQEVPMSAFETVGKPRYRSVQEEKRTKELARQIQENKELNPLIVVKDAEGHYILEGGHRFDALRELDINSFPALMVHDLESLGTVAKADGGKIVKGASKVFKKLFKDDVLPAAERDANLAKFLEPSKTPMRLYHGTMATEGGKRNEAIRRLKPSKEGALGSGVYMTPKPNYASNYALDHMTPEVYASSMGDAFEAGNVLPVHAQIRNPLIIGNTGERIDPAAEALMKLGIDKDKAQSMVERLYEDKGNIGKQIQARAQAQGYDGLMLYHTDGTLGEVVSYNPNAVKSAIGNQGTYNTSVPDLSKANGGLAHMGKGGKMSALGKLGKRLMADPDAVTPTARGGTRKFGNDASGLNIIKETGGNWSPSGDLVYQSNLDRELDKLKKGRFDTPINVIKHNLEQDALAGNTARKAQLEQALVEAQKTEAANKWVDSNLKNYVTKQMATEGDPVRKLAEEGIKAFPVNIDEFGDAELRTYGSAKAKQNRKTTGYVPEGVAKSPLAKHYETMTDESISPVEAKHYQRIQALPPMQRPTGTMDAPWMSKLDPETPIFSLSRDADFNKFGFDHIMDVLREDLAAGRIRPEQMNKISMEQAVRRTHEYDEALKAKMLNARIAEQANANVFKEYPEGYKWVQLDKPGQFNLESDIMGHSVRGYEPPKGHPDYTDISGDSGYKDYGHGGYEAIKSGQAKIYSLRDPKGMSHVTVEVGPNDHLDYNDWFKKQPEEIQNKIAKRRLDDKNHDIYSGPEYLADRGKILPKITQIKGKQNAAPNEEYLPFVQDFVKSGQYSEVGDLSNTGLRDVKFMTNPDVYQKYLERGLKVPKYATEKELDELHNEYLRLAEPRNYKPPEGMAEGGGAFKKLQFMGGGGITTSGGTFSPEELGVNPSDLDASKYGKRIARNAADLSVEGKEQLEKEYRQLANKGAKKDALIRIGSQILGSGVDFANLGLEGLDLLQSAIPALSKPESVLDVAGTGDRVPKFKLATEEPFFGSEHFLRKFKEAKLLGENEFPLTEFAANLFGPAVAVGALKKGKKAYEGAKLLADKPKKKQGGLTAMAR